MYDFANILFTGFCNLKCYDCIGNKEKYRGLPENLNKYPIENIDGLIKIVNEYNVNDLAFTGINTDPQLYKYEKELIQYLRENITGKTNLSLHTNGQMALKKIDLFNSYDKASLSIPSFNPETYAKITGGKLPDVKKIIELSEVPVKLSMIITPYNKDEIADYIKTSSDLGVKRLIVRKLAGREKEYPIDEWDPFKSFQPVKYIFGNPVYKIENTEVTVWDFDNSECKGVYLFSDGKIEKAI